LQDEIIVVRKVDVEQGKGPISSIAFLNEFELLYQLTFSAEFGNPAP
jgi:hypothetical protein